MIDTNGADRQGGKGGLSWFLWRPRYARLWWIAAALFWLMVFFVEWLAPGSSRAINDDLRSWLIIGFHPFIILAVLASRLYWRLLKQDRFAFRQCAEGQEIDDDEGAYDEGTIGFHRVTNRGLGHPIDPRSPLNPLNPLYRIHHRDR